MSIEETKKIVDWAFNLFWEEWYGDYEGKMPVDKMTMLIADTKCRILNLININQ